MDQLDTLLDDARTTLDRLDDDARPATTARALKQIHGIMVEMKKRIDDLHRTIAAANGQ